MNTHAHFNSVIVHRRKSSNAGTQHTIVRAGVTSITSTPTTASTTSPTLSYTLAEPKHKLMSQTETQGFKLMQKRRHSVTEPAMSTVNSTTNTDTSGKIESSVSDDEDEQESTSIATTTSKAINEDGCTPAVTTTTTTITSIGTTTTTTITTPTPSIDSSLPSLTFDEIKLSYDSELYTLQEQISMLETRIKKADYRLKLMSQWKMEKMDNKINGDYFYKDVNNINTLAAVVGSSSNSSSNNSAEGSVGIDALIPSTTTTPATLPSTTPTLTSSPTSTRPTTSTTLTTSSSTAPILTERTKIRYFHLLLRSCIVRHFSRLFRLRKLLKLIHKQFFDVVGNYLNYEWDSTIENNVRIQNEIDSWYNSAKALRSRLVTIDMNQTNDIAYDFCYNLKDIGDLLQMLVDELRNRQLICRQVYTSFYTRNKQIQLETHSIVLNNEKKKKDIQLLKQEFEELEKREKELIYNVKEVNSEIESHSLNERKLSFKLQKQLRDEEKQRADQRRAIAVAEDIQRRLTVKTMTNEKRINEQKEEQQFGGYNSELNSPSFCGTGGNSISHGDDWSAEQARVAAQHSQTWIPRTVRSENARHKKIKILPFKFQRNKQTGLVEEVPVEVEEEEESEKSEVNKGDEEEQTRETAEVVQEENNGSSSHRADLTHIQPKSPPALKIARRSTINRPMFDSSTAKPIIKLTHSHHTVHAQSIHNTPRPKFAATTNSHTENPRAIPAYYSQSLQDLLALINRPLILKARTNTSINNNSNANIGSSTARLSPASTILIGGITPSRREKFVHKLKNSPLLHQITSADQMRLAGPAKIAIRPSTARPSTNSGSNNSRVQHHSSGSGNQDGWDGSRIDRPDTAYSNPRSRPHSAVHVDRLTHKIQQQHAALHAKLNAPY